MYLDDLLESNEDDSNPLGCTGDPSTCPCDLCSAFRIDMEADRDWESEEDQHAA